MILDLILKNNTYVLKINRKFFQNESIPLHLFQEKNQLMEKYSYLGTFQIKDETFGFGGCFKKQEDSNEEYAIYKFVFPEPENSLEIRKMILTIYLSTYYVVEQMHCAKEFFEDIVWNGQAFSFVIFDGVATIGGYAIGGQIYPWVKRKLFALNQQNLSRIRRIC